MKEIVERKVSRIILIDAKSSILLVSYSRLSANGQKEIFWVTPGGGVNIEESSKEAAKRELKEETGLELEIGPLIFTTSMKFKIDGKNILSNEKFFLAKTDTTNPKVSNQHYEEAILELKWWNYNELYNSNIILYPESLLNNLKQILSGDIPDKPIEI